MGKAEVFDLRGFPDWAAAHLKITDAEGNLIPFILNPPQRYLHNRICRQYETLGRVDVQILKARQMGFSTYIQALKFYFMLKNHNRNGMTIAHKEGSTSYIFSMQKMFYDNCDCQPDYLKWNRAGIEFNNEDGTGLNNRIMVETAGGSDIGRSFTLHFLHCSEVASWDKMVDKKIDVSGLFGGLNQAIRDRKGTFKFIESTAQGEGYFKEMWYDPPPDRVNIFFPWVAMPDYRMDCSDAEAEEIAFSPDRRFGDELKEKEKIIAALKQWWPDVDSEKEVYARLKWRRYTIRGSCEGKLAIFRQEYPTVEEDAFRSAEFTAFDAFYLSERLHEVKYTTTGDWKAPHTRWNFNEEAYDYANPEWWKSALYQDADGPLVLWENPERGSNYIIGADACYGTQQDEAAAIVWKVPELLEVASFHGSIDADQFAELLAAIGFGYYRAKIAVEIQGPGLSTLHTLERMLYPNLYQMPSLNKFSKAKVMNGFFNNVASKPLLAGIMRQAIRERLATFNSPDFIEQLLAFHETRQGGKSKFEAAPGKKDDMVIAGAIGLYASGRFTQIERSPAAAVKLTEKSIAYHVQKYKDFRGENRWVVNK